MFSYELILPLSRYLITTEQEMVIEKVDEHFVASIPGMDIPKISRETKEEAVEEFLATIVFFKHMDRIVINNHDRMIKPLIWEKQLRSIENIKVERLVKEIDDNNRRNPSGPASGTTDVRTESNQREIPVCTSA